MDISAMESYTHINAYKNVQQRYIYKRMSALKNHWLFVLGHLYSFEDWSLAITHIKPVCRVSRRTCQSNQKALTCLEKYANIMRHDQTVNILCSLFPIPPTELCLLGIVVIKYMYTSFTSVNYYNVCILCWALVG